MKERQVDAHEISRRAYEIYLERGGEHGADLDDWLQAERELAAPGRLLEIEAPAPLVELAAGSRAEQADRQDEPVA